MRDNLIKISDTEYSYRGYDVVCEDDTWYLGDDDYGEDSLEKALDLVDSLIPYREADIVEYMTIDEVRDLPNVLGKIATAMCLEYGFYAYTNTTTNKKVYIMLIENKYWFRWGDEGPGKVTVWNNKDDNVVILGKVDKETLHSSVKFNNPYS